VVRLLYDWTAHRYDRVKGFAEADEGWFLGRPLVTALADRGQPRVLDVATGTGRLPLTLLQHPKFDGQVWVLDRSTKMLDIAVEHLESHPGRVRLLLADAAPLPIADDQFDAVTCLEALEFFPNATAALHELVRVLEPGGWLLISNRVGWEARLMPGHTWSRAQLIATLRQFPLTDISVRPWQTYYDLVWARKKSVMRDA
jgi:ubiquinone/menaquinone biosynthesis C-methylase UbiE